MNADKDLNHLQPFFRIQVEGWLSALKAENILLKVTETLRSFARQEELFALGRSKPGSKVTNARGGQSNHHWGLALDCYPIDDDPNTVNLEIGLGKPVINFDRYPHLMTAMKRAAELGKQFEIDWAASGSLEIIRTSNGQKRRRRPNAENCTRWDIGRAKARLFNDQKRTSQIRLSCCNQYAEYRYPKRSRNRQT